jgi:hypothetical protein
MVRFIARTSAILSVICGALYVASRWLRSHRADHEFGGAGDTLAPPQVLSMSGPGLAVDHERQPGVPPPDNDDYDDPYDRTDADSFPASDPPSSW